MSPGTGAAGARRTRLEVTKIDSITGASTPSSVTGGAITLHTGTTADLSISSSNATAFAALGFSGSMAEARTGGAAGTGTVIANDQQTFTNESISGGAVTVYNFGGNAGQRPVAMGQDRQR